MRSSCAHDLIHGTIFILPCPIKGSVPSRRLSGYYIQYSVDRRQRGVCEVTVYWRFIANVFTVKLFILLAKCCNKSYTNTYLHRVKPGEFILNAYAGLCIYMHTRTHTQV